VIASADLLPAMKQRSGTGNGEVLAFSDAQAHLALEEILKRRPGAVELERHFAATPRGAALINRIKADPALAQSELRVVSHDGDYSRILPRAADLGPGSPAVVILEEGPEFEPAALLDQRGTRRAPRFKIAADMTVLLDGSAARLVDVSTAGAQVLSPTILKPNQRVRVVLTDNHGALRFNAAIVWVLFELPSTRGPLYRAGVRFVDADSNAVGAFCNRHKQTHS
jgi:PilZ domain-containing protein